MKNCRVIARPATGASGIRDTGRITTRLPEELLSEQVRRVIAFTAVIGGLWSIGLLLDVVILPLTGIVAARNWRSITLEVFGAVDAAVLWLFLTRSSASVRTKGDIGLAVMLVNAFGVGMLNTWAVPPPMLNPNVIYLSWMTILILVYSMISPSSTRKMFLASVVAAAMDPLGVWLAHLRGVPVPSLTDTALLFWPNFACAAIAVIPSRVLQKLGKRLREAQDLGSYQLVELLGHGGMGEVWRAKHRLLARDAAIKLVKPEVLGARTDAEARLALRRFEREAQATASLSSPHSIQLFDFGTTQDGNFYYVMELLLGRDLESLVREFGPLPANRAIYLLRQVCHSLADAHARGMVHRDIKPANIYACRMGLEYDFVKVLDFGLVKFNDRMAGQDTLATLEHTTTGTPAYMAPETILGNTDVDRRADVYAVGCVAYYLLTGQLVFEAETSMQMLMQHLNAKPAPPSQRTELPIPRELDELVLACLEKDPNRRPQNAGELFRMAYECRTCDGWNQAAAGQWWDSHLPEFTGPLSAGAARGEGAHVATPTL